MNRSNALMNLAPGQELRMSDKQLGVFFCGETFAFVLNPSTRRAAQRVARWHGCTFRFNKITGSAAFVKRDRASGFLVSRMESVVLWSRRALTQARLRTAQVAPLVHFSHVRAAHAGR
jgi:hypothetical protein